MFSTQTYYLVAASITTGTDSSGQHWYGSYTIGTEEPVRCTDDDSHKSHRTRDAAAQCAESTLRRTLKLREVGLGRTLRKVGAR